MNGFSRRRRAAVAVIVGIGAWALAIAPARLLSQQQPVTPAGEGGGIDVSDLKPWEDEITQAALEGRDPDPKKVDADKEAAARARKSAPPPATAPAPSGEPKPWEDEATKAALERREPDPKKIEDEKKAAAERQKTAKKGAAPNTPTPPPGKRSTPPTSRPAAPPPPATGEMKRYESKYYVIFTDLGEDGGRETSLRMTRMAEEYYNRTKDFSGKINKKFPFYLFSKPEDYYAAGGAPGSAGVFMGGEDKLMAIAIDNEGGETWHVVQHEGFHQFAHAVIGGERPAWVNEGLAEYFGESIWTGDGFVTGVLPPRRLKRVQEGIGSDRFQPFPVMMTMTLATWNRGMSINNYDQAWSMTHFLALGENGRYQKAFAQYMNLLGRKMTPEKAWAQTFGDASGFQERWEKWTLAQPPNASARLYAEAKLATLTSFFARAMAQRQTFDTAEEFLAKAESGELKASRDEWLPPSLLKRALGLQLEDTEKIVLDNKTAPKTPRLVLKLRDGTSLIGNYKLAGQKVSAVWVDREAVIAGAPRQR